MSEIKYRIFQSAPGLTLSKMRLPSILLISGIVLTYCAKSFYGYGTIYKMTLSILNIDAAIKAYSRGEGFWSLGRFEGNLVFLFDRIEIKDKTIFLDDIESISLDCSDYLNKPLHRSKSKGVFNYLVIELKNGTKVNVQFEQLTEYAIRINEQELVWYCKKGKIKLLKLIAALGLPSYAAVQDFKLKHQL